MEIAEQKIGRVTLAILDGRLDTASAAAAEVQLLAILGRGGLVADMTAVRYVSSAGLRVLLRAAKQAKATGVHFALCGLQPAVLEVFEISGFDRIIPAHSTRAEALAAAG